MLPYTAVLLIAVHKSLISNVFDSHTLKKQTLNTPGLDYAIQLIEEAP